MQRGTIIAVLVVLAGWGCGFGGKSKEYLLEQMSVQIQPPSGWTEQFDKTWGSLKFVKSPQTQMHIYPYCLNCEEKSYSEEADKKIQSEVAALAEAKPARLKKKEEIKPGVKTYVIETGRELIVGAHHIKKGVMGILNCEATLGPKDRNLLEEVQKRCADLVIATKK
ncbi:MAG: hypothetical protein HY466_00655 [Deltaproteobacteria bacterium]|nr:hypothetical protein [Deltaproteobacteria bacterium]